MDEEKEHETEKEHEHETEEEEALWRVKMSLLVVVLMIRTYLTPKIYKSFVWLLL